MTDVTSAVIAAILAVVIIIISVIVESLFGSLCERVGVCFFSLTKAFFIRLAGGQQKRRRKVASLNLHFHQPRFNAPFHGVIQIETRAR